MYSLYMDLNICKSSFKHAQISCDIKLMIVVITSVIFLESTNEAYYYMDIFIISYICM
jgi:hypothetical protein